MQAKDVRTSDLKPYERNPRKIPEQAVDAVAESIKRYGFRQPIVVDENLVIIAGHTRWLAARKLGLETVPVVIADLDEARARAYRIADNRTHQFTEWDTVMLAEELERLGGERFTGFTDEERRALSEAITVDDVDEYQSTGETEKWCIEVPKELAKQIKRAALGLTDEQVARRVMEA